MLGGAEQRGEDHPSGSRPCGGEGRCFASRLAAAGWRPPAVGAQLSKQRPSADKVGRAVFDQRTGVQAGNARRRRAEAQGRKPTPRAEPLEQADGRPGKQLPIAGSGPCRRVRTPSWQRCRCRCRGEGQAEESGTDGEPLGPVGH